MVQLQFPYPVVRCVVSAWRDGEPDRIDMQVSDDDGVEWRTVARVFVTGSSDSAVEAAIGASVLALLDS